MNGLSQEQINANVRDDIENILWLLQRYKVHPNHMDRRNRAFLFLNNSVASLRPVDVDGNDGAEPVPDGAAPAAPVAQAETPPPELSKPIDFAASAAKKIEDAKRLAEIEAENALYEEGVKGVDDENI